MAHNASHNQDAAALAALRHSAAHLLAAAVLDYFPEAKPTIGPATDEGFYYDFDFGDETFSEHDLERVEEKMHQLVAEWHRFERQEVSAEDALKRYPENEYKAELIRELVEAGETISLYQSGEFVDLCRGGHVDAPASELKHFKLLSVAGAYWRGSEKNPMLTRIYGTAFFSGEALAEHLEQLETAKERDHRKLGRELKLYFIDEVVGKGLVMWLPNGVIVRDEIEKLAREMEAEAGYVRVVTPHIAKRELFETSGHLPYYQDDMFPGMQMDDGEYYLKAMNCPHHHRIFLHEPKSYRELPVRLAEYGTCYRNELSGTLAGLLRVRGMAMNDAHIYCTRDQIKAEFRAVLELIQRYFEIFELENYWFRLSKWDPAHTDKYINEPENWEYAQGVIREVLEEMQVEYTEADDEAAFYGPKVDVQFRSAVGREETMSTVQLDFAAKSRFGLSYTDESGEPNGEVFVIHRAPLSVHERFLAFVLEQYAGKLPVWLSPVQVKVLPISEAKHGEYARSVATQLRDAGLRVSVDDRPERLQAKIRQAEADERVPYMLVVGDSEAAAGTVSVRKRGEKGQELVSVEALQKAVKEVLRNRV